MLAEAPQTRQALDAMFSGLGLARTMWEDLEQEALVHCWRQELNQPGQSARYYLRGCRYFVRNMVRAGRSVDSLRHRASCCVALRGGRALEPDPAVVESESPVISEVALREMIVALASRLAPLEVAVLRCLDKGFTLREAARALRISHTTAIRARLRIARLAVRLGYGDHHV